MFFFLYPDEDAAKAGKSAGGTGFFVAIPSESYPDHYHHVYAVTNWHVVMGGSPVIRVNNKSGPPEIFAFEPHEWVFIPGNHDIAVIPISLNPETSKAQAIAADSFFLTEEDVDKYQINAAEDVFMLGRFMDYDGAEANLPSMRFGNISMMKAEIKQPTGYKGKSIVVDMHSRTGYSGSPVFVYRTHGSVFAKPDSIMVGGHIMKLLGILWGQFTEDWDLHDKRTTTQTHAAVLDGKSVRGWSGMSLVSPATAIRKVLYTAELKRQRSQIDAELHNVMRDLPAPQN